MTLIQHITKTNSRAGQMLVELLLAVGLAAVIIPSLLSGFVSSKDSRAQQSQRVSAIAFMQETKEALRSVREKGWTNVSTNGTYHPALSGDAWTLSAGGETVNGLTRSVVISDAYRDAPRASSISSTLYMTRYLDNAAYLQTTSAEFNADTLSGVTVPTPPIANGEVQLSNDNKAKWCSPSFAKQADGTEITINLPDGPPVAVSATASASVNTPNDVYVATAPTTSSSIKMAYVNVTANTATPAASLVGTFTLDATKYSAGTYPSSPGLDNSFKTNAIKSYKSGSGKQYALIGTDKPDREVVVAQVNNGSGNAWQDPTNHIYKYWTYFNTKQYVGDNRSTPNQDQAPFGYGATTLAVSGTRGYMASGGYLYVFDLSNIDSKTTAQPLDMLGCRIELDGYDCNPGSPASDKKYNAGQTGASWGDTGSPAHNDCSDGGNIELHATNDIYPVTVGANQYVFVAIGGGTNPEFEIVNVTTPPTSGTALTGNNCGRISAGAATWKRISTLDFNTQANTEEAANSVYATLDGTRAYVSSNGGIDANNNGSPDSYQMYVINTSNKNTPVFLPGNTNTPPANGYYYGSGGNEELYPRRSLTVLNGQRAILVGKDGKSNATNAKEYQVVDISNESAPTYCGSVDYDSGFNDLTSVSEADGDNFVYMVANTPDKQLKIIQGGPDYSIYVGNGTLESTTFDPGYTSSFNRYTASMTVSGTTALKYQFAIADPVSGSCSGAAFNYLGPDGTAATYYTGTNSAILQSLAGIGSYKNPARCFRYKAFFSTTDFISTPILNDITVNYAP
ncbi:hypothetical protein HYS00_05090 [Candidatus Microgenomates bacterium]|nr:hypothetical protein [Candidatus Microgenomates bacterium]